MSRSKPYERKSLPAPCVKRMRPSQIKPKTAPNENVPAEQGSSQALMRLPVEIFAEIFTYLTPGDLVTLIRSNKFLRELLLRRSAVQMWRHAESNVSHLPPCPPDMCEPQYAALMFSNHCTLCGASVTNPPNPNLRVRLCASCRNTELKDVTPTSFDDKDFNLDLFPWSNSYGPKGHKDKSTRYTLYVQPTYGLKREVEEILGKQRELVRSGDKSKLEQWREDRRKQMAARHEHSEQIRLYLGHVSLDQLEQKRDVGKDRRQMIKERLMAMGWTEEDMRFGSDRAKPWNKLVEAYRPLTDRAWKGLLPKLIPILQENRQFNTDRATLERRVERRKRIDDFLSEMRKVHPFQSLLDALGPGHLSFFYTLMETPFPKTKTALKWGCLNDLGEREISVEQVEADLAERKDQVEQTITDWRADIERRLVERFDPANKIYEDDVVVTVKGSTDTTAHLSRDSRILLRADTIFRRRDLPPDPENDLRSQYGVGVPRVDNSLQYYPNFVCSRSSFFEYGLPGYDAEDDPRDQETNLDNYERYTKAEEVVKPVLKDLGMPDAAWAELKFMDRKFLCGRCIDKKPKTWGELVEHYIKALAVWNDTKDLQGNHHTRHPVVFRNVHDLESTNNPKQLARSLSEEEAAQLWMASKAQAPAGPTPTQPLCYLCESTGRKRCRLSLEEVVAHMQDVHDVAEPAEGLHYGAKVISAKWHKEWDAFHDARVSASTAALE